MTLSAARRGARRGTGDRTDRRGFRPASAGGLTSRELASAALVAEGKSNKAIADATHAQRADRRPPRQQHSDETRCAIPHCGHRVRLHAPARLRPAMGEITQLEDRIRFGWSRRCGRGGRVASLDACDQWTAPQQPRTARDVSDAVARLAPTISARAAGDRGGAAAARRPGRPSSKAPAVFECSCRPATAGWG